MKTDILINCRCGKKLWRIFLIKIRRANIGHLGIKKA